MVTVFLFVCIGAVSAAVTHDNSDLEQKTKILLNLASNFTEADNDFTNPRPNSAYFPLIKSRSENEIMKRLNYSVINSEDHAVKITGQLKTWRGFEDINASAVLSFVNLLLDSFSSLPADLQTSLLESTLNLDDLQKLPLGWQYLLPHQFYEEVDMSGADYATLVNNSPGNSALLFKIAMVLRDESNIKKQQFINSLNMPDHFREDLGYILGYRWGVEEESDATEDFKMETFLHLPPDVIMGISEATFESLNLPEKLTDTTKWDLASPESKVAWYTVFEKYNGWGEIAGTPRHVRIHGHLMSGAPMDKLRELKDQKTIETSLFADVLDRTDMNPIRVQEVWEALSSSDKQEGFVSQARKLDVSQILDHYKDTDNANNEQKTFLEDSWLAIDSDMAPWVNMLAVGFNYMKQEEYVSWTQKQLQDLGKFVAILSPSELDLVPADNFDSSMLSTILSPMLSLSQLTSIYLKFIEQSTADALHPVLLSALPSAEILSPTAPFIWSKDKTDLLAASALFSPAQMQALHVVTTPGQWSPSNMSAILSTHPHCLADINPHDLRLNLDHLVQGVYTAGPDKFHTIASKIQSLPRHLLMAWLEETHDRPGSKKMGELWSSDVLLDRVTPASVPDYSITNPFINHPLAAQFDRFTSANRSLLPSLALAGMSCHCINLVETPDTLQVLALFRYHLERDGSLSAMPSSSRKCWAKKVRQFLQLKSLMFNVTVNTEPELLSLLTTSDIKAIGGEVLLTWGGPALASITHPEVMHEVLMAVSHTHPHLYVRNGVTYECMKVMANAMLDFMIKEEGGKVNLRVLTHVHNLVPYSDNRILEASAEDIKLFISTVLRPVCKAMCLKNKERELVRQMILKGYGLPDSWTSLDLTQLGDLLMVLARSDLAAVKPTALRRAAAQLSATTLWTTLLSDVRSSTKPVLYHEACGAWLGGKEGGQTQDAIQTFNQWNMMGQFIVVGSFLQVEVLMNEMVVPKPRNTGGFSRRKRQADVDGIDYKSLYSLVMNDMKTKFDAKELTDDQKTEATRVITETQKMLGDTSFDVLGLERGDKSQSEVLAVLAEYKDAGNMTEEQNTQVQKLAVDTQVRMIQELVTVLGLTAQDLELSTDQWDIIMARQTFVLPPKEEVTPEDASEDDETTELLTTTEGNLVISGKEAPDVTTLSANVDAESVTEDLGETTDVPLIVPSSTTSASSTSSSSTASTTASSTTTTIVVSSTTSSTTSVATPVPDTPILEVEKEEEDITEILKLLDTTFKAYEPSSDHFTSIPSMEDITLSCDVIIAAGPSASSISASDIASMSSKEVTNCLDILGHLPWPGAATESIWNAVKTKVIKLQGANMLPVKRSEMFQLQNLLPAIATVDPDLLDMDRNNIDGISLLGRSLKSDDATVLNLVQRYITVNDVTATNPFTIVEAAAMGQLLCGLKDEQWKELVTPAVFSSILTQHLSQLDCSISNTTTLHLATMLTTLYGSTDTWTSSDLLSTGWLASILSPDQLSQLQHHSMEGLTGQAVKQLSREQLSSFSHHQLAMMSPHAASFISRVQLLPHTNKHRRRGIRAAGGEDEKLVDTMEMIELDMQVIDEEMEKDEKRDGKTVSDETPTGTTGGVGSKTSSVQVLLAGVIFLLVLGV